MDFLFVGDLIDTIVWDDVCDDTGDLVGDGVGHLSAGNIWNMLLNFEGHLSLDIVRNLNVDFVCLELLNFIVLIYVVCDGDLVWNFVGSALWHFLGDLILLSHVVSDFVMVCII
jgi:hypothetical protein